MENRRSAKLCVTSTFIISAMISLLLIGCFSSTAKAILGTDPVTGAIWTSDPNGERVNGNLYANARKTYLAGGPHKEGAAGLPDGIYYFQVTDPAGKQLLSKDEDWKRRFNVTDGYIHSIDGGTHKWNDDTTRGYGIVVQLWPFKLTHNKGGVYKVWVTREDHYDPPNGCFGFIPSLSKTDNFKVKMDEAPKYFELWVTDGISRPLDVAFHVNYTVDSDGDPVLPWTTGQLIWDRREGVYDVFRYETSFALGSYIYWQFFISNTFSWISDVYGPELIYQEGMVNKETLFKVNGTKYNYLNNAGLDGWTIELYKDGEKIAETQTGLDGYYEFVGLAPGNYSVCEVGKNDEGWAPHGPTCYNFTAEDGNSVDQTFDFYNYEMLEITDTSEDRWELPRGLWDKVFTPSNDGSGMYKLSSTNPGSFYVNVVKYGEPDTPVRVEVSLPPDQENGVWYDSLNFILHHTYIGSTPVVDIHVYGGRLPSPSGGDFIPDYSKDVTNLFNITPTADGKNVTVVGNMPETGLLFVTVHVDFQIDASLTWNQVQFFNSFEWTFRVEVYFSKIGVSRKK